ncbi:MAG: FUSC family protein [Actinomycetota bacterium]
MKERGIRKHLPKKPALSDYLPAIRIGLSIGTPLVILKLSGNLDWSLYAIFGGYTSTYGRTAPHLDRLKMQAAAGTLIVLSLTAGTAVGAHPLASFIAIIGIGIVGGTTAGMAEVFQWRPSGALFMVFAFGACASTPETTSKIPISFVVGAICALSAIGIGSIGKWQPEIQAGGSATSKIHFNRIEIRRNFYQYGGTASLAMFVSTVEHLSHPYWAAMTAVVPLSATSTTDRISRGLHRLVGTFIGLFVADLIISTHPHGWVMLIWIEILLIGAELFVLKHYGTAMVFMTPMALLMTQLNVKQISTSLVLDRGITTVIGVAIGLSVLYLTND